MSSNEISNEGAVKINHDKPIVPDVALSAMSNNVGESNVTDVTVTYETLSSQIIEWNCQKYSSTKKKCAEC